MLCWPVIHVLITLSIITVVIVELVIKYLLQIIAVVAVY